MRTGGWLPWRRWAAVWAPAAAFLLVNLGVYVYLGGSAGGRAASLRKEVEALEATCASLHRTEALVTREREQLQTLRAALDHLNEDVFGSLEKRLTGILRTVETATRSAGLHPARFSYDAKEDEKSGLTRFGIRFSVEGKFRQIETLLQSLRASDEFLIVDRLNLSGEEGTRTDSLKISIHVATYLVQADRDLLRRLVRSSDTERKEDAGGTD